MPEGFDGSRRKFIGYAIGGIAGAVTIGYALPLADYVVGPALKKSEAAWSKVGSISELQVGVPASVTFSAETTVGWREEKAEQDVWVVKKEDGTINVFSPVCPHLGCGYHWDAETSHFRCPCHLSLYDMDGRLLSGPAPRGLDTLPSKVEDGVLYVQYEKFRLGISKKELA